MQKKPVGQPGTAVPGQSDPSAAAEFALLHRPSFSIRKKIALSFSLSFLVIGALALASSLILQGIEQRLYFLDRADIYTSHIQQARRFEKNFFLYGTGLPSALEHARAAHDSLLGARAEIRKVLGPKFHSAMLQHLEQYQRLLSRLQQRPGNAAIDKSEIEAELRTHGGEMVAVALRVVDAERKTVWRMLRLSKQMPIVALAVLLTLIFYVVHFLARQILAPLGRMVDNARRIAEGDFSPILPARKYRDEFTDLALAMNRMVHELYRRQEMLAESQKLRAIGTLTAGVAHELNNPINNISLTAEAILEDYSSLSDEERLDMCRDLLSQAERAHGVVRNLLDFSRQRETHMEPLDVGAILRQTDKLLSNQIKLARVDHACTVAQDLPPVLGDRPQLAQVFVNLYLNALEAMGQGGQLRVGAALDPERGGFVRITVSDTGSGIPEEVLPYVFDPFFTTKGAKGTGLGLSVSYGIVNEHRGTIAVDSRVGAGTTFTVDLPVAEPALAGELVPADAKLSGLGDHANRP